MHPYATKEYARSLVHMGSPIEIPEWESWAILRPIDGGLVDACGPYPLTVLARTADLSGGMERLRKMGAVSATLVLDDFNRPDLARIAECCDIVTPFKTHYVVDRSIGDARPSKHHRYEIRSALECVTVRQFDLKDHLSEWTGLYGSLVQRHGLRGIHNFPENYHNELSNIKNIVSVGAFRDNEMVSAHIWVMNENFIHSHLAASSNVGYTTGAAYAVNDYSIRLFSQADIINLGGGAGQVDHPGDGLARFKHGFANSTSRSYICGKILDSENYEKLIVHQQAGKYFPAYRATMAGGIER